jgi:hypothetical protein
VSPAWAGYIGSIPQRKSVEVLFRLVVVGLGRDTLSARCDWHAGQDGADVVVETVTCPTGVAASYRRTGFVLMDDLRDVSEGRILGWLPHRVDGWVSNEMVTDTLVLPLLLFLLTYILLLGRFWNI